MERQRLTSKTQHRLHAVTTSFLPATEYDHMLEARFCNTHIHGLHVKIFIFIFMMVIGSTAFHQLAL